ncbi:TRAP transporter TatT component family protein [Candidatus Bipolaricaulota bacterium]|nr:TRAP transporter TatT component family protein [Candidatus Bipolaricaulota bacterium]
MIRVSRPSLLGLVAVILFAGFVLASGADSPLEIIAQADLAYMTRYLEEGMTEAISLFESTLPCLETLSVSSQAYVLNRLSQLCYEAALFTQGNTPADEELFIRGKEYGLRSLRLNAEFVAHEPDGFEQALAYATDIPAMHWAANNWGMLCGMNPIQGLLQQGSVLALFSRCVELDPDFWGASAASALGSLLIMLPGPMGGDDEAGLKLVEDSIVADPSYLHNHIILAEYWGFTYNMFGALTGVRDAELIERETAIVLEGGIGDWPFWNRQAKTAAERLLAQLRDRTD